MKQQVREGERADRQPRVGHRMNLKHKRNTNDMNQMSKSNGGNSEVRSVTAHNAHKRKYGKTQQGGTTVLLYELLIEQHNFEAPEKDPTGLE